MSDMSTPAGNAGGDPTTPIAAALSELPPRIRVHALAKLLNRSSREVLAAITELGADGRSVQSSIDRELALRVAETLGVTAPDPGSEVEAAETASASASAGQAGASSTHGQAADRGASAPQSGGARQSGVQAPGFRQTPPHTTPQTARQAPATGSPGFTAPAESSSRVIPPTPVFASASPLFLPPEPTATPPRPPRPAPEPEIVEDEVEETEAEESFAEETDEGRPRRRRGRRGRGRGKGGQDDFAGDEAEEQEKPDKPDKAEKSDGPDKSDKPDRPDKPARRVKAEAEPEETEEQEPADGDDAASRRRRRRRRRRGGDAEDGTPNATEDDPPNTVVHVREAREEKEKPESDGRDEVRSVRGSTRLEAKRQRRRDGREAGRRRAPILSEAEFLARREAVDRAMVVRERGDRIQMGVLEDGVLVEHFVTSSGTGSLVGNVYLGRVQNVLPSMEAAFVDIGRGRNAVLYAGEVDWDAAGLEGKARKIEQALSTGDSVLVQVTKDPVGHKGARLTTQISLPGRFLVYVPGGGATGISRKLPENERRRLKDVLKRVVPEDAGVIIRTASEGISEEELARDVRRLQAQWQVIKDKTEGTNGARKVGAPSLVYEEPDLLVKVVRDLFTEDFSALVVQGDTAWETVEAYVRHVAPELADRVRKHVANTDVFAEYRIDEQLLKALDRKVWLPSGGYLVIDRTEAMTVIDVNTGKFTGSGGNLEETVTRNNLESAEEIVRQLRLRDIGGIIVIDFIDMVLESNRDLVLRRLTECLGRDRTRHQVAEVTSLGLVQMTRKRVGTGLLEAFGTTCEHCKGRGVLVTIEPMSKPNGTNGHTEPPRVNTRRSRGRAEDNKDNKEQKDKAPNKDVAKDVAAQAAKDAVRGIAKATTKVVEPNQKPTDTPAEGASHEEPAHQEPAHQEPARQEPARQESAHHESSRHESSRQEPAPTQAEEPQRTSSRHRSRDRSHRGESRNGRNRGAETPDSPAAEVPQTTATTADDALAAGEATGAAGAAGARAGVAGSGATGAGAGTGGVPAGAAAAADDALAAGEASGAAGLPTGSAIESHASAEGVGAAGSPAGSGTTFETATTAGRRASGTRTPAAAGEAPGAEVPGAAEVPAAAAAAADDALAASEVSGAAGLPAGSAAATADSHAADSRVAHGGAANTGASAGSVSSAAASSAAETPAAGEPPAGATSDQVTPAGADELTAPEFTRSGERRYEHTNGSADRSTTAQEPSTGDQGGHGESQGDTPSVSAPAPSVPAPVTPPRRQPRRAASRPAGPPVSARHDG
ncbi:Rne/Rng family ribonuclease [Actinophytocola sp.]|uniref:Rne/Rng family ribonuclease n=1 Tax=Actinophytocola sp. TaxID=1872138 RepID=UPI00389A1543